MLSCPLGSPSFPLSKQRSPRAELDTEEEHPGPAPGVLWMPTLGSRKGSAKRQCSEQDWQSEARRRAQHPGNTKDKAVPELTQPSSSLQHRSPITPRRGQCQQEVCVRAATAQAGTKSTVCHPSNGKCQKSCLPLPALAPCAGSRQAAPIAASSRTALTVPGARALCRDFLTMFPASFIPPHFQRQRFFSFSSMCATGRLLSPPT